MDRIGIALKPLKIVFDSDSNSAAVMRDEDSPEDRRLTRA
jgi:hypothetical protein